MDHAAIDEAVKILRAGGIILYPTDTIWGLGCDATNEEAVNKLFLLKQRPAEKSFVVLVNSELMLERYIKDVPEMAWQLIEITETPLTIIYPGPVNISRSAIAQDGTLAVRLVKHAFCYELLRKLNKPVISTSANISGENAPSRFEEISKKITGGADYIVPRQFEGKMTFKPSSIIKLGLKGEISIIRK